MELVSDAVTHDDHPHPHCRKCGSEWLVRSRRRWWERLIRRLNYSRPYRCRGCGARSWFPIDASETVAIPDGPAPLFR